MPDQIMQIRRSSLLLTKYDPALVGEGTVPSIRKTLSSFGISESEFINSCDVTFKQSIKFVNWLDRTKHGNNNFYHHLFDMPSPFGEDLTPYWLINPREHFADLVSSQHAVCEEIRLQNS
ncbi:tryptophan 7-halogenase [Shewanella baltica]|uniref:tryptophan 7-halogenase n=1 Tax=Shewanella baltica TaxID=62322 RepID=UPI00217D7A98